MKDNYKSFIENWNKAAAEWNKAMNELFKNAEAPEPAKPKSGYEPFVDSCKEFYKRTMGAQPQPVNNPPQPFKPKTSYELLIEADELLSSLNSIIKRKGTVSIDDNICLLMARTQREIGDYLDRTRVFTSEYINRILVKEEEIQAKHNALTKMKTPPPPPKPSENRILTAKEARELSESKVCSNLDYVMRKIEARVEGGKSRRIVLRKKLSSSVAIELNKAGYNYSLQQSDRGIIQNISW